MIDLLFGRSQEHQCYNIYLRNLDKSYDCKFLIYQQDICQNILKVSGGHLDSRIKELRQKFVTLSNFEHEDLIFLLRCRLEKLYTGRIYNLYIYIFIYISNMESLFGNMIGLDVIEPNSNLRSEIQA